MRVNHQATLYTVNPRTDNLKYGVAALGWVANMMKKRNSEFKEDFNMYSFLGVNRQMKHNLTEQQKQARLFLSGKLSPAEKKEMEKISGMKIDDEITRIELLLTKLRELSAEGNLEAAGLIQSAEDLRKKILN